MSLILDIHSLTRWIIVIVAAAALIRYGIGWLRAQSFTQLDRQLMTGTAWLLILQFVLGTIYLIGNFNPRQFEHALPMIIAVGLPHIAGARAKKADSDAGRHRIYFLFLLGALLLIVVGVFALPGGWSRNAWLN